MSRGLGDVYKRQATDSVISAAVGFIVALIAAYKEKSLLTVALFACAAVFIVERILEFAV